MQNESLQDVIVAFVRIQEDLARTDSMCEAAILCIELDDYNFNYKVYKTVSWYLMDYKYNKGRIDRRWIFFFGMSRKEVDFLRLSQTTIYLSLSFSRYSFVHIITILMSCTYKLYKSVSKRS